MIPKLLCWETWSKAQLRIGPGFQEAWGWSWPFRTSGSLETVPRPPALKPVRMGWLLCTCSLFTMVGKVSCNEKEFGKVEEGTTSHLHFCSSSHVCKWVLLQAKNFWWASGGGLISEQFDAQKSKQMHSITMTIHYFLFWLLYLLYLNLNLIAVSSLSNFY